MSEKRRGLGRGLGALIPSNTTAPTRPAGDRPVDVFFPGRADGDGPPGTEVLTATGRVTDRPASLSTGLASGVTTARPTAFDPGVSGAPVARGDHGTVVGRLGASSSPISPGPVSAAPVSAPELGSLPAAPLTTVPITTVPITTVPSSTVPSPTVPSPGEGSARDDSGSAEDTPGQTPDVVELPEPGPIDDGLLPVPGVTYAELPVGSIRPNPKQPRQVFDEEAMAELVHSVQEIGVLQPVVVRSLPPENGEARYELIMGERRLRATSEAGLERIPAIIRDTQDDDLLRDALLENLHRAELNALEEAAAYQQLLDDFGCTHEELATRIGRSRPQISNTLRLLRLPPLVQRRVAAGVLSAGHARALLGLEDAAAMERLAQRIVAEGLSVRAVEEIVSLGDGPVAKPAKRRPRAGSHTSELNDLASRLGDRLDTKVSIALGRTKGRINIDFASVDDLNRILDVLSPEVKGAFRADS